MRVDMSEMTVESITIEDCIEMAEMKDFYVVLNDGRVVGFEE